MNISSGRARAARRSSNRLGDDDGVALVTVIGMSFVMVMVLTVVTAYAVDSMPRTRNHEDWNAALAAAEAGVDDALYRLNQNPNYWATPDPDNDALTGWRELPGLGSDARYHYRLDTSQVARTGAIDVTAIGRVGDQRRSIDVRLRRDGFLDNIYFTDFEASDPFALVTNAAQRTYLDGYCAVHHPHRDTRNVSNTHRAGGCSTIRFVPGDVIDGPLRSNDALLIRRGPAGPRFLGRVFTGWNFEEAGSALPYLVDAGSTSHEPFFQDGITYRGRLDLPQTSRRIADQAAETGCRYEGPTYIRFHRAGEQPRMSVVSPLTDPATAGSGCGTGSAPNGTPFGVIRSTVNLKDGEVFYVGNSERSGVGSHPLQMPHPAETETSFSATAGDIFVHGELDGQITLAAENDVVIVWDLTYRDATQDSDDLLGLIADNNVWVYHPVSLSGSTYTNLPIAHNNLPPFRMDPGNPGLPGVRDWSARNSYPGARLWEDPEIHAAIMALNRSFGVQDFRRGAPFTSGELTVYGAIAQRWRGPVGTTSSTGSPASGYLKDYRYDWRLRYLTPPYFIEPERSPWERRRWAEVRVPAVCGAGETPADDGCRPPD